MKKSLNNRLIVEVYSKEGLQSEVKNGFAKIQQKIAVKGLKILMDAQLSDGTIIPKGHFAYIKEEELYTKPWAQKSLQCDAIGVPFLIVDITNVEFIEGPDFGENAI